MLRADWRLTLALLTALLCCAAATAHPMLIIPGALSVDQREARIDLRVTRADMEHLHLDPDDAGAALRYAQLVSESLAVVDARGRRLAARDPIPTFSAPARAADGAALRYALHAPAEALSVRILPGSPLSQRGGLLHLRRGEGEASLRLTPDGAAQTIRGPSAAPPDDPSRAWAWHRRFDRIHALIGRDEGGAYVDVIVPVPLVATWLAVPRAAPDALTREEAAPTLDAFAAVVRDRIDLRIAGRRTPLTIDRVGLLAPNEPGFTGEASADPLAYWSAAAAIRLRAHGSAGDASNELELHWRLFNAAIKRAHVRSDTHHQDPERAVTPYAPVTLWR